MLEKPYYQGNPTLKAGTAVAPEDSSSSRESRLNCGRLGDQTSLAEDSGPRL